MAEVEVTVIPLRIEGPLRIAPFECPCCHKTLIIDRIRRADPSEWPDAYEATLIEYL